MFTRRETGDAGRLLLSTTAFGASIATAAALIGTRDLESYEHSFFSLDRGTGVAAAQVLGHPVYSLALGLGVRLPLHGGLGASPAVAAAPYVPMPVTYWLLIAFAVSAAVIIARAALEPLCGRAMSWVSMALLFCSAPLINYALYSDWPETAVTYCAFVGCVFAPHALLEVRRLQPSVTARRVVTALLLALVWHLVGASHPGYWPLVAVTLIATSLVALGRSEYSLRSRLTVVAALAAASLCAVLPQAPDLARELRVAGMHLDGMRRFVQGPEGGALATNLFPFFGALEARRPFTYLLLAVVSLIVAMTTSKDAPARRLVIGSSIAAILLSVGAGSLAPGGSIYMPSTTWALRDPAIAFAILSGGCAAGMVDRDRLHSVRRRVGLLVLVLAAVQGTVYATSLMRKGFSEWSTHQPWTRDLRSPGDRLQMRGFPRERATAGDRVALWPGVRDKMRNERRASTDFPDAGYPLVTAWTKQRTMRQLVEPNPVLFNQSTDLSPRILCDPTAVQFLQLRYLLVPPDVDCPPWARVSGALIDNLFELRVAERDHRIRAIPVTERERTDNEPALSAGSALLPRLVALPRTSLDVGSRGIEFTLDDPGVAGGHVLVFPVAFDEGWRSSSGFTENVGGLLGLVDARGGHVVLEFVPDAVATLRAASMTVAQLLGLIGLAGLAFAPWLVADGPSVAVGSPLRALGSGIGRRLKPIGRRLLRQPQYGLYLAYAAAVVQRLEWSPQDVDDTSALAALLLPITALMVSWIARRSLWHRAIVVILVVAALVGVAVQGSLSAEALQDPLFWGAITLVALAASAVMRRWRIGALIAAAIAGGCALYAILLPQVPMLSWPAGLAAVSHHLGTAGTVVLVVLWIHAIGAAVQRSRMNGRGDAVVCGALVAALFLAVIGGLPIGRIPTEWFVSSGVLLGLAEARRQAADRRADGTIAPRT